MSSADIERIRQGFEAYARGDMETALQNVGPDFVVNDHIIPEDTTGLRGPDALASNLNRIGEAFPGMRYELLEFVDLGETVVVRVVVHVKGASTELEISQEVGQVWTAKDGKATSLDIYASWEEAKEAAGG